MLVALGSLALGLSCGEDTGVAGILVVATIDVDPPTAGVVTGQTLQLTAIPKTEGGIVLPADHITWSSTDQSRATVSPAGLVQAVSVGGPVRIRATMSGVTGEAQITVMPVPVDRVVIAPPTVTIPVGGSTQLTAHLFDASGVALSGRLITWSTGSPSIAAVTTSGMVIGQALGGPVTITATSEGKSGTAAVTVSARPATRLGFLQQPGTTIADAAITPAVTVAVQDDLLGTVGTATNSVTIALGSNPGSATLSGTKTVAAVNGVATFSNLSLNRAGTGYTLVATAPGLTSATSAAFNVVASAATQLTFTVEPPATARSGIAFPVNPVLQVRDASGNPAPTAGILVSASIQPGSAALGGTLAATTNANGAATFNGLLISGPVGSYTLTFTASGLPPLSSESIALAAGNPSSLSIVTQPSATAQSGIPFSRQPVVRLLDGAGNVVSQSGVAVTASIASGPAGGALGGTGIAATDGSGIATFTNLSLSGPAGSYTLRFSSGALTAVNSAAIELGAGSGSTLALTTQPSSQVTSGQVFPRQPVVQLRDASGNPVTQAGVMVAASIQTGGGQLLGTTTVATDASGTAAFGNLAIDGQPGDRILLFASAGYISVVSNAVTVVAPSANKLAMATQPSSSAQTSVAFPQQPIIQVTDGNGIPISQASVPVTVAVSVGNGTLGGVLTVNTDAAGRAAFSGLSITGKAGNYTLVFSSPGLTSVTSATIALQAGPPALLTITTQPSATAMSGVPFPQQPVLQVQDADGNAVPGALVTATIASGGGTLGGSSTATSDANGVAAFTDLSITGQTGVRTLSFSTPGVSPVESSSIILAAGSASQLTITTQPSATAQNGVPFSQQPAVRVTDALGNPVSGVVVTAAIASGGGTLGGTSTATSDVGGIAAFSDLSITGTIGARTLDFSATGLSGVTSNTIDLTAGPATQIVIVQQPSSLAHHGDKFVQQPIVQLFDAGGNPVVGVPVTASINSAVGTGRLQGRLIINTDSAGLATFTDLKIDRAGLYTLKFTSGQISVVSILITVT